MSELLADRVAMVLEEVIAEFGRRVVNDPRQLRGLMHDALGVAAAECHDHIEVVVAAATAGVPQAILAADGEVDRTQLRGLLLASGGDTAQAERLVEVWLHALKVQDRQPTDPAPTATLGAPGVEPATLMGPRSAPRTADVPAQPADPNTPGDRSALFRSRRKALLLVTAARVVFGLVAVVAFVAALANGEELGSLLWFVGLGVGVQLAGLVGVWIQQTWGLWVLLLWAGADVAMSLLDLEALLSSGAAAALGLSLAQLVLAGLLLREIHQPAPAQPIDTAPFTAPDRDQPDGGAATAPDQQTRALLTNRRTLVITGAALGTLAIGLVAFSAMHTPIDLAADDQPNTDTDTDTGDTTPNPDPDNPSDDRAESDDGDVLEAADLGEVRVGQGEEIQIRSLETITGDLSFLGTPNLRATELAIADYGDIQGFSVNLGTPLDDLCSSEGGQASAQTIVADETVIGVIGTTCTVAAFPASELISTAGMVMISGSNGTPSLTQSPLGARGSDFSEGYYRTANNELTQGAAIAEFVVNVLGLTTAATIHDGDLYSSDLTTAFRDDFELLGGEVLVSTSISWGDTDMVPVLTEVAAASPEVIFVPIFSPEINHVAMQIGGISGLENVVLIAAEPAQWDGFLEIPESEGFYFSNPILGPEGNANSITGQTSSEVLAEYNDIYGEAPFTPWWAHAYDATTMLLQAIDAVAVRDGEELVIARQGLRDALYSASFRGLSGSIDCDEFGDCGAGVIQIVLHTDSTVAYPTDEMETVYTYIP